MAKKKSKKLQAKTAKVQLNVDLKKYLDQNLARDNLNLIKQLEKANEKVEQLEQKLKEEIKVVTTDKDKVLKNIEKKLVKIYEDLDARILKEILFYFKSLLKDNLKVSDLYDIVYSLLDKHDGDISTVCSCIQTLQELYPLLSNYVEELK